MGSKQTWNFARFIKIQSITRVVNMSFAETLFNELSDMHKIAQFTGQAATRRAA